MLSKGKINIGLTIPWKRPDGYHEIRSVFVPISLGDKLEISIKRESSTRNQSTISLQSTNQLTGYRRELFESVSERGDFTKNILWKTFVALQPRFLESLSIELCLEKLLPPEGGIGGGSSNAASLLIALRPFTDLKDEEFFAIAKGLGADIPFFLLGKPAYAKGIGDILEPIDLAPGQGILWIPEFGLSTSAMYAGLQKSLQKPQASEVWNSLAEDHRKSLQTGDWAYLQNRLQNEFERIAFLSQPSLRTWKERFLASGAVFASMSGSGSCLYGIYPPDVDVTQVLRQSFPADSQAQLRTFSF